MQRVDVVIHLSPSVERLLLRQFEALKNSMKRMERQIMDQLADITAAVTENGTVIGSAVELLNGLSAKIAELKNDPVALAALSAELRTKSGELSAAVTANTPSEEEPPVDPNA